MPDEQSSHPGGHDVADAAVDDARVDREVRGIFRDNLPWITGGLAIMFLVLGTMHVLLEEPPLSTTMPYMSFGSVLLLAAAHLWTRARTVTLTQAAWIGVGVVAIALANTWVNILLVPDPLEAWDLVLVSLGVGLLFTSVPAAAASFGLVAASSVGLRVLVGAHPAWPQVTAAIIAGLALGVITFIYRRRTLRSMHHLRMVNEVRTREMEQANRELARSNRELEEFASVASHDLREPLRMVSGYLGLIDRRFGDDLDPEAREFLAYAEDGAKRMDRLVSRLLDYARVGQDTGPREVVDAREALDDAMANLRSLLEESGARIEHGDLPAVEANIIGLSQLFQNLVGNAVEHRGEESPVVRVWGERSGEDVVFHVADNGPGIPEEDRGSIFDLFHQGKGKKAAGHGIGLAVCKRIVEHHGGSIWVEEDVPDERGAVIGFTLPAADEAA